MDIFPLNFSPELSLRTLEISAGCHPHNGLTPQPWSQCTPQNIQILPGSPHTKIYVLRQDFVNLVSTNSVRLKLEVWIIAQDICLKISPTLK